MSIILTNGWTHAKHGHSRGELDTLQHFLNSQNIDSVTVGFHDNNEGSGEFSLGFLAHKAKFDHTKLLKKHVDKLLIRDLIKKVNRAVEDSGPERSQVCFTSVRVAHVKLLQAFQIHARRVGIRLLDVPQSDEEWAILRTFVHSDGERTEITWGVQSSARQASDYSIPSNYVPDASALQRESTEVNERRDRIGIFWPVGRSASEIEVHKTLNACSSFEPIVKLPSYFETIEYARKFPGIEFIANEIPENIFRAKLSTVKLAILAHKKYVNQNSGYASYFVTNNVPVLTSAENTFFKELGDYGEMYDYRTSSQLQELTLKLLPKSLDFTNDKYFQIASERWNRFLKRA